MATITYQFFRDWIFHDLAESSRSVTEAELQAVIAEQTRIITTELEMQDNMIAFDDTIPLADGYVDLPADCAVLYDVFYEDAEGAKAIPLLKYNDISRRNYYTNKGIDYFYTIGRVLYPSWTITSDIDVTLHYQNFFSDAQMAIDSTEFGSATTHVPVILSHVLRYACLADLMLIHARKEDALIKAQIYEKKFKDLIRNARKNLKNVAPTKEYREIKDY